jgi:hypothetical protein
MADFASESGHWYQQDGTPCYEVPNKSKGGMRPTTLRDARKMDLVPSATTILDVLAKPALEKWKAEQLLMAALTLSRLEGEAEKDWIARVWEDSEAQGKKARERGTAIHAAIELAYRGEPFQEDLRPWVEAARAALPDMPWAPERSFASPLGYGGKVDLHCPEWVVDIKTRGRKQGRLPLDIYPEQLMQLAAYRYGLWLDCKREPETDARCANLIVSQELPAEAFLVEHSEADMAWGLDMFLTLLAFWKAKNRIS